MKVLIVDNDTQTVEAVSLCFTLRWPDAKILTAPNGETALELIK